MASIPLLFEVGIIRSQPVEGYYTIQTLLVHALVVDPRSISWADPPRDTVTQSVGGATHTKSDRVVGSCQIAGTFGFSERAFGTTTGDGPTRQKRFENEVLRLSSAATREKIDEVIREASIGAVGLDVSAGIELGNALAKKLKRFNPVRDVTFVNVYDFYNRRFHVVGELNYRTALEARGGGSVGMQQYTLSFTAYGAPIVANAKTPLSRAVQGLTDILPAWQRINDFVSSSTAAAAVEIGASAANVVASQVLDSLDAVATQLEALTALAGGSVVVDNQSLSALLGTTAQLATQAKDMARTLAGTGDAYAPSATVTELDWSGDVEDAGADRFSHARSLHTLAFNLDFQRYAGRFLGLSDTDYAAFLEAGGNTAGTTPTVASTVEHRVTAQDTPDSISAQFGVSWVEIVRVNRILEEDVVPGVILQIPRERAWGPTGIDGLPVFGSHVGNSALGADLKVPIEVEDGDFATVTGVDCIRQGVALLKYKVEEAAFAGLESIPPEVVAGVVAVRARLVFEADPRFQSVRTYAAASGASVALRADMQTVNGLASQLRTADLRGPLWDTAIWDEFEYV